MRTSCRRLVQAGLQPGFLHQVLEAHVEGLGDLEQGEKGDIIVSALYPADVTAIDFCHEGEPFLRDPLLEADFANGIPQGDKRRMLSVLG